MNMLFVKGKNILLKFRKWQKENIFCDNEVTKTAESSTKTYFLQAAAPVVDQSIG